MALVCSGWGVRGLQARRVEPADQAVAWRSQRVAPRAFAPFSSSSSTRGTAARLRAHARLPRRCAVHISAVAVGGKITPPYNVVITGSSKGIGRGLAEEFLKAGDNVVICSRDEARVVKAVEELSSLASQSSATTSGYTTDESGGAANGGRRVVGRAGNVARATDMAALADFAVEQLGSVDIWINNAGSNAYSYRPLAEQSEEDIVSVVETNVLGVMLGCKEAIRVMRQQPSGGHIFNMDGAGADGGPTPRFAAYGATKRSLEQLSKSLRAELRMLNAKQVGVHNLSPGMVTTDLLMAGADTPVAKFFINCLAERPETVAQELVPQIRAVPAAGKGLLGDVPGQYIRFLTKPKAYGQILTRLATGARKNRFVSED